MNKSGSTLRIIATALLIVGWIECCCVFSTPSFAQNAEVKPAETLTEDVEPDAITMKNISNEMIDVALARAENQGLTEIVKFQVADAHDLPFDDTDFNVVMTEFVSIFLDKPKAFSEFYRVLKPGGFVGINELYKSDDTPEDALEILSYRLTQAEILDVRDA